MMDEARVYEIQVGGHLPERWSDWFEGLSIRHCPSGITALQRPLADQAALFGVLAKIQALNLDLISIIKLN